MKPLGGEQTIRLQQTLLLFPPLQAKKKTTHLLFNNFSKIQQSTSR